MTGHTALRSVRPCLTQVVTAGEAIPEIRGKIGHSGPPLRVENLLPLHKHALLTLLCYEQRIREDWLESIITGGEQAVEEAIKQQVNGKEISLHPNQPLNIVAPLVGMVSESMPLLVIEDLHSGRRVFTPINEGLGPSVRGGDLSVEVVKRLIWMKNTLAPVLAQCLEALNGIELLPIVQEALRMGDELHMRNHAASMLMNRLIHSVLFKLNYPVKDLHEVSLFLQRNPFFFLNLSMALAKLYLQSFEGKEGPPVVTACGANGNEIGFQISTEPGQWYTEQSPVSLSSVQIEGPLSPAIGDSFVVEVFGMGGRLTSLSPSLWESLGIRTYEQIAATEEALKKVAVGTLFEGVPFNPLHWQGIAIGLDAEKMAQGEVPLVINTAVLHRQGGIRGIGRVYIPNEWMRKVLKNGKKMG